MYLRRLRLKNLLCFEDIELSFVDDKDKVLKWTVILGENGTGKSAIIRSVALLLSGLRGAQQLLQEPRSMVRYENKEAIAEADVDLLDTQERSDAKRIIHISLKFLDKPYSRGWGRYLGSSMGMFEKYLERDYGRGAFVCGYGATRFAARERSIVRGLTGKQIRDPRIRRLQTLFNEEVLLTPIDEWLMALEYEMLKSKDEQVTVKPRFRSAVETLSQLLPAVTFKEINSEGIAIFNTPYGEHPLSALSRGYQDVLTWVTDLTRQLIDAFPKSDDPLREKGIVLVEEIALHLHPIWQRVVISYLRKRFPNLQFIVTTHSPLAAQSLNRNELVILRRVKRRGKHRDTVSAERSALTPKGLSADQMLTSPAFGLTTAKSVEVEKNIQKFNRLKLKAKRGAITQKEAQEYNQYREFLIGVSESPGDTFEKRDEFHQMQDILIRLGREDLLERPPIEKVKQENADKYGAQNSQPTQESTRKQRGNSTKQQKRNTY